MNQWAREVEAHLSGYGVVVYQEPNGRTFATDTSFGTGKYVVPNHFVDPKDAAAEVLKQVKITRQGNIYGNSISASLYPNNGFGYAAPLPPPPPLRMLSMDEARDAWSKYRPTPKCQHEFVNVSFAHIVMACKHCNEEQK